MIYEVWECPRTSPVTSPFCGNLTPLTARVRKSVRPRAAMAGEIYQVHSQRGSYASS